MSNRYKLNLHWTGLNEEGQIGIWYTVDAAQTQTDVEGTVTQARVNMSASTWKNALTALLSPDQSYDKITGYYYPAGATRATYGAEAPFSPALAGTGTSRNALQCALVATLQTGHRGASYRGRIYLPFCGKAFNTDHQALPADVDAVQAAVAGGAPGADNLIDSFRRACIHGTDTSPTAVIWSQKLGVATPITSVKIDSKVDIQRRRAKSERPSYTKSGGITFFTG